MSYIVLIVESMYFQNLIKIVSLISLLIQVSTHSQIQERETRFVVIYNFIYNGKRERENCPLPSLYLTIMNFHSIKQKWINITLNTSSNHHRISNLYMYIYCICNIPWSFCQLGYI